MNTTTPPQISRSIQRLIDKVTPNGEAVYLAVLPESDAVANECFPNVQAKIEREGGQMLCGWQIWEWPHVMVEAEFHAVWLSPEGQMIDITPKPHGETQILFVPDDRLGYSGVTVDNKRMPLRDDQLIRHFIAASEAITRVMNKGERISLHGHVSVPAAEINPLLLAQGFLGESLTAGLRDHDPCLCGSGGKYKRCHGRQLEAVFGH